jgi:hypothetical protein
VVEHEAATRMGHHLVERHRRDEWHEFNDEGQQDIRQGACVQRMNMSFAHAQGAMSDVHTSVILYGQ